MLPGVQHTTVEAATVQPGVYQPVEKVGVCDHLDVSCRRQNKGPSRCGLPRGLNLLISEVISLVTVI